MCLIYSNALGIVPFKFKVNCHCGLTQWPAARLSILICPFTLCKTNAGPSRSHESSGRFKAREKTCQFFNFHMSSCIAGDVI